MRRRITSVAAIAALAWLFATGVPVIAQTTADQNIRISQIYTHGGESGAIYQADFIELYNRGNTVVDINGWSLSVLTFEGSGASGINVRFFGTGSMSIPPGMHMLFTLTTGGASGQPLAGDFGLPFASLGSTGGQIVLLGKDKTMPQGCPAAPDPTGAVVDYVGYGSATCFENAVAPAPPVAKSLTRILGGCADTNNNLADFALADPNPRGLTSPGTLPCSLQTSSVIQFEVSQFDSFEGAGAATITATRTGDISTPATVDYLTSDGTASERTDYTTALGTLTFAPGEAAKTFNVLINTDNFVEANETVSLTLQRPTGNGTIGLRNTATLVIHDSLLPSPPPPNPIDTSSFLVEQNYHDFLNRVPDNPGLLFWINNIESCGSDAACREAKRIDTSAAFFLSIEFQRTGFLVYRTYKATLSETARPRGLPRYREFMRDTQEIGRGVIVNTAGWDTLLEANTVAFFNSFVTRDDFRINFPLTLTPAQYVDALNAKIGGVLTDTERTILITGLFLGSETRATVLRKIAENPTFSTAEFNRAFVLMQYFGYLRRGPDELPNTDFSGFDFWLNKLNQFGNYQAAEMVKAFVNSDEYRKRFGQ